MVRVRVIVEGPTEASFVQEVLYKALTPHAVFPFPTVLGTPGHRGGNVNYQRVKNDILKTLKQDQHIYCSTFFDFYGLGDGFPTRSNTTPAVSQVQHLEQTILRDIMQSAPNVRADLRLMPYIQLYEFEGILFSDPTALASGMFREDLARQLHAIRNEFASPEEINNSPETAPSKRILNLHPNYNKIISGTLAAEQMGVDVIRQHCPRFNAWFDRLAALGTAPLS
jgi:hypothetical protein